MFELQYSIIILSGLIIWVSYWIWIRHFWVSKMLIKMKLSAKPFLCKWVILAREWKINFASRASQLASFCNRGLRQLGNSLFYPCLCFLFAFLYFCCFVKCWNCPKSPDLPLKVSVYFFPGCLNDFFVCLLAAEWWSFVQSKSSFWHRCRADVL